MPAAVTGSFTAAAQVSGSFKPEESAHLRDRGFFNVAVWGTFTATAVLERSFDDGTTWVPVYRRGTATAISYTEPGSEIVEEPEAGVLYRLRCSAFTSGSINYRLSA